MIIVTFEEKHQLERGRYLWLERSRKFEDEDATKDFVEVLYKELIDLGTVREIEVWNTEKILTKVTVDFER